MVWFKRKRREIEEREMLINIESTKMTLLIFQK
jgi:hypothetical protein